MKDRISGDDMYLVQSISKLKPAILHIDPNSFVKTSAMKSVNDFFNQRIRWSSNAKLTLEMNHSFLVLIYNNEFKSIDYRFLVDW